MSTQKSTTGPTPTRGSTSGAGAAESIKETVHHIQDVGEAIRENAMDFVDTMFGTPRHGPGEPGSGRVGAANAGQDVHAAHAESQRVAGDVPGPGRRAADDATARTSTPRAGHASATDVPVQPSERPVTGPTAEAATTGKGGGDVQATQTQPPPLPRRDV